MPSQPPLGVPSHPHLAQGALGLSQTTQAGVLTANYACPALPVGSWLEQPELTLLPEPGAAAPGGDSVPARGDLTTRSHSMNIC